MVNDPISDTIVRLMNAQNVGKKETELMYSKTNESIASTFQKLGYIDSVEVVGDKIKHIKVVLNKDKKFSILKRISHTGARIYKKYQKMHAPLSGRGLAIISTPNGIMTHVEARRKKLGGEYLLMVA